MKEPVLDVVVTRGDLVESSHLVHGIVVDSTGSAIAVSGDPDLITYWRSCAKPFQVMPLIEADAFDALGWEEPQLALSCGSHGGEPEHVAVAAAMLADIGLEEGDLVCGPHEPLAPRGMRALRDAGEIPGRLHNNCSGKHAAMLARAVTAGWSPDGYERADHRVQQSALEMISRWSGVPVSQITLAVDGCGVPVVATPLRALALAYARLGHAAAAGEDVPARVLGAMVANPFLVGGTGRFDTDLMTETSGGIVAKVGAEGVHAFCVPALGIGGAIKVQDGAQRAQYPALLSLLSQLGLFESGIGVALQEHATRPVRNTRREIVGSIDARVAPRAAVAVAADSVQ